MEALFGSLRFCPLVKVLCLKLLSVSPWAESIIGLSGIMFVTSSSTHEVRDPHKSCRVQGKAGHKISEGRGHVMEQNSQG